MSFVLLGLWLFMKKLMGQPIMENVSQWKSCNTVSALVFKSRIGRKPQSPAHPNLLLESCTCMVVAL